MSGFTVLATGNRRHNEKERWVANALRHESVQLHRRLRILGQQQQRELAMVRCAQLELTKTFDQLRRHRPSIQHALTHPATCSIRLKPLHLDEQQRVHSCCPNHIVCSSCNLRLRLADVLLPRSPQHSGPCIATHCPMPAPEPVCIACRVW